MAMVMNNKNISILITLLSLNIYLFEHNIDSFF